MKQQTNRNRRWVLASRPHGAPQMDNFRLEEDDVATPGEGQVLLRTVFLSLDPYMRGRMSDEPSYAPPVEPGCVMVGGTVSRVVASNHPDYRPDEWVLSYNGWQDYDISDGEGLVKLGDNPQHPSWSLGILGMPGFTAYMGLLDIGQPKEGETLVVAAATGPVGATVGQIGKLKGCRVVGIAGGAEKCRHATDVLGFDLCLDHHADNFPQQLAQACPQGIDIYYENVGGKVFDAVLPLLNTSARIPLCGLVSGYNATALPDGPDRLPLLMATLLKKRIRLQGFIINQDYGHRIHEFQQEMGRWIKEGKIHYREQITDGLENAPEAFMVPEISLESLLEINTIRTALEEMAVVAAAGKITPDREQTLNALLDEFQQALESGVMEKILLANRAFRFEIYHYADMPTLYAMIEQLWVRLGPSLHFLYDNFKLDDYQNGVNLYRKLLNALVTGDKEASRHCLQNVLQQNVATIKNQYFM
ncbi:GntR family transcriptional regulator [Salmonella enterica]|nr:GntR family transcriptional regulator [Salmonella enterica subsp. enterica serovar Enteritidis]EAM4751487.1 GntR family transcriptional regulator [Salmonella enterica]EAN2404904.1 GntR family transcriptional regulator [Salmonella enterica]EAN9060317.1 GntR family transcriptional regulator [Salmonella enterica]EAO4742534.1 GntR family transcriptional regulator [Salmonella enterica]